MVSEKKPNRTARILRGVRRVHMYLGLLMVPWVFLFGITALSFNHPTVGRGLEGQMIPPDRVKQITGFSPWAADEMARSVVAELPGQPALVPESARYSGWPLFASPAPGGKEVVIFSLDRGMAILTKRIDAQESAKLPFSGAHVPLEEFSLAPLAGKLSKLHGELGVTTEGPLRPHPKIHPELRFQAKGKNGELYNIVYDMSSQVVDGRRTSEDRHAPFVELLESLHKQHHYPANFGPTFFWALMADLLALTLLFWGLSGIVMWWQMKKFRVLGGVFLLTALILSGLVMTATANDLTFGPERTGE